MTGGPSSRVAFISLKGSRSNRIGGFHMILNLLCGYPATKRYAARGMWNNEQVTGTLKRQ
jgi:hypothetical protein